MHVLISGPAHQVRLDWRRPWRDPVPVLFYDLGGSPKVILRDLEYILREEEAREQVAIAALVQRALLLSGSCVVSITALSLGWTMLSQLPGRSI